jgi:hypothetical protein
MWDGFNQRKFPRLNLECEIALSQGAGHTISGRTENVGIGGVCLIQNQPLERFSTCRIRLSLAKGESPIECDARIVWNIPCKDPAVKETLFDTGVEFVNLPSAESLRMKKFIEERIPGGFQRLV